MTVRPLFPLLPACLAVLSLPSPAAAEGSDASLDAVTIFGRGQTRQVSELRREDLDALPPGSSALKGLEKLPGVNFQSADPFGAYEWSTRLSVRGFSQNQLGYTLDGVPLGDMSYRNHNGLHISRAISSENLRRTVLSQGAGALDTASTSNLGGAVQFHSEDPAEQRGGRAALSFGESATRRGFVKLESGRLGGDGAADGQGTRISLSLTDQRADKWKGEGRQEQQQVNTKLVSELASARLSAFLNGSSRKEVDYQDLSKALIARLGDRWDNYYPDWNAALDSARGTWTRGETSVDDAYYAGSGLRKDWLAGATLDWNLNDDLAWRTTVYQHRDRGPSLWYTPYQASSDAVPVSLRTVEYEIRRHGLLTSLEATFGAHQLSGGAWIERNRFDQAMRFYSQAGGPSSPYDEPSDPMLTRWDYRFTTRTLQLHLRDAITVTPRLKIDLGVKALSSRIDAETRAGAPKNGSIEAENGFLPQAGVNLRLDERHEVFAAVSRNMRAYKGSAMEDSPFATTSEGFEAIRGRLKPETSTTLEAGWRQRTEGLETSVTAYHVDFRNRLLGIQAGSAIAGNPTVLANVGRVRTDGIEAGASWQPAPAWRLYASASWNDSRYAEDFVDNGSVVAVSGKQVVDAPKWLGHAQLAYDDGRWSAHLGAHHVARRYYTYLNDNGVDPYTLWDAGAGWRQPLSGGWLRSVQVRLSVANLADRHYVASIGTNGFVTSDPQGTAQTLLVGAPRSAYLTVEAAF